MTKKLMIHATDLDAEEFTLDLDIEDLDIEGSLSQSQAEKLCHLLPLCRNLSVLSVISQELGPEYMRALALALPECRSLSELRFRSRGLGSESMKTLAQALPECRSLSVLDLMGNEIGPEGIKALALALPECRSLSVLNLGNEIGPEGIQALALALPGCPNLSVLDLSSNMLGPEGMRALARVLPGCHNLSVLDLSGTFLGPKGMKALAEVLPKCLNLSVLYLGDNKLGPEGMEALSLALLGCPNLRELHLRNNSLGREDITALAQAFPRLVISEQWYISSDISNEWRMSSELFKRRAMVVTTYLSNLRTWGGSSRKYPVDPRVCLQYIATDKENRESFCRGLELRDQEIARLKWDLDDLPVVTGLGREYLMAVTALGERDLQVLCLVLDPVLKRGVMDEQVAQLCDSAALRCQESEDMVGSMAYYAACDYQRFPKTGNIFGNIFLTMCPDGLLKEKVNALVTGEEGGADVFLPALNDLMKSDPSLKEEVEAILVLISETQIKIAMHPDLILASFKGVRGFDLDQIIEASRVRASLAADLASSAINRGVSLFSKKEPVASKAPEEPQDYQGGRRGCSA